jgi:hypothetical protein
MGITTMRVFRFFGHSLSGDPGSSGNVVSQIVLGGGLASGSGGVTAGGVNRDNYGNGYASGSGGIYPESHICRGCHEGNPNNGTSWSTGRGLYSKDYYGVRGGYDEV